MFGRLRRRDRTEQGLAKTRRRWFDRLGRVFGRRKLDEGMWEELEELLISGDVGVATTRELVQRVRQRAQEAGISDAEQAQGLLKEEMVALLQSPEDGSFWRRTELEGPRPLVILVVGVNGVGKTTGIAKLAHHLGQSGKRVVLGAADTFRAAAIEQLQVWGQRLGVDVVAHQPGGDPGAVAYDAFRAAQARRADVLLVDTAGRLHTKVNLMEEMKKVSRVLKRLDEGAPHHVLLVLDATTGHNGLTQARAFTEAVGCDGVFLAKLDGTAKGGIVLAVSRELKLPVVIIGTGEGLDDMALFDPREFVEALFTPLEETSALRE